MGRAGLDLLVMGRGGGSDSSPSAASSSASHARRLLATTNPLNPLYVRLTATNVFASDHTSAANDGPSGDPSAVCAAATPTVPAVMISGGRKIRSDDGGPLRRAGARRLVGVLVASGGTRGGYGRISASLPA